MGSQQALLDSIDARTKLVGSNKMEILLFSLGTGEVFGINVFKVREVSQTPAITKTPNTPPGVEGVISLRGNIIPVISLAKFTSLESAPENTGKTVVCLFQVVELGEWCQNQRSPAIPKNQYANDLRTPEGLQQRDQ